MDGGTGLSEERGPLPGDVDVSTCGRSDEATRQHVGDGERGRREEEGHRRVPLLLSRVVPDRDGQVSVGWSLIRLVSSWTWL